jgi:hypothetical protein
MKERMVAGVLEAVRCMAHYGVKSSRKPVGVHLGLDGRWYPGDIVGNVSSDRASPIRATWLDCQGWKQLEGMK